MNYWHMQLHPDDLHWEREVELLENYSIIGFSAYSGTPNQRKL